MQNVWLESQIETMKQMFKDGFSHAQIGRSVGRSRNAVIGKVHRMGLHIEGQEQGYRPKPQGGRVSSKSAIKRPRSKGRPQVGRCEPLPETPTAPDSKFISLIELSRGTCHFPYGDPQEPDFSYCGAPVWGKSSYCASHARLCYTTAAERRAERAQYQEEPTWDASRKLIRKRRARTPRGRAQGTTSSPTTTSES